MSHSPPHTHQCGRLISFLCRRAASSLASSSKRPANIPAGQLSSQQNRASVYQCTHRFGPAFAAPLPIVSSPSPRSLATHGSSGQRSDDPSERGSRLPSDFLSNLQRRHPGLAISTNPYELEVHGRGESHHPASPPDAVVYPSSVEEIRDILRLCCRETQATAEGEIVVEIVSVVAYGAGTSVEGHLQFLFPPANVDGRGCRRGTLVEIPASCFTCWDDADHSQKQVLVQRKGGISIDMRHFQFIGEVGPGATCVKVGAGVTRQALNKALRHTGMQFMVDPGADATIGGMTACGASGTAAVKYGTMRENVLAMTVVLPPTTILSMKDDGTSTTAAAVHCGTTALKSSAGYNLPGLLTGSEGTLGIIADVTVRLHPVPSHVVAASCAFDDLHSAAEAVAMIRATGIPVARLELLDAMSIRAFNQMLGGEEHGGEGEGDERLHLRPMPEKPTLFIEFTGHSNTSVSEDLSAAQRVCVDDFAGTGFVSAADEPTCQALWAARHRLYYASIALRAGNGAGDEGSGASPQTTVLTDACVPLSHFADVISATARDVRERGVVGTCFGHAGDGNFHCILPLKADDTAEYRDHVSKVMENLTERAIEVGGTCTGEHGVGYGKKKYLRRMYGEGGVKMMESVKKALDPLNVLNPGKIINNDFYGGFQRIG